MNGILRQHLLHDGIADRRVRDEERHRLAQRLRQVGMREDGVNARQGARGGCVDAPDARMRERASHEGGLQHAGQVQVIDEAPFALEERRVLQPRDPAADPAHDRSAFAAASAASTMP